MTKSSHGALLEFSSPLVFLIWGGNFFCEKTEILAESTPVDHADWRTYIFDINPKHDYKYVTIEVYYKVQITQAYNGHILIDNISPIVQMDCE